MLHLFLPFYLQNHGLGKVGPVAPTFWSRRIILENLAQDCIHMVLGYLQWGRLQILSGQSVPGTIKNFFLMFRWNFLCINFHLLHLVLLLGTTETKPDSILLAPSLQTVLRNAWSCSVSPQVLWLPYKHSGAMIWQSPRSWTQWQNTGLAYLDVG